MNKKRVNKNEVDVILQKFNLCIPWMQVEFVLGRRKYNKFCKWMGGQTVPTGGVWYEDVERFLREFPIID